MRINKTLVALLGWSIITFLPAIVHSQEKIERSVREFTNKSLNGYIKNVITEKNCARFNFKNLAEAKTARLGDPYKIMFIGLETLKSYKSGASAKTLLKDIKTLWFPVVIEGVTKTKLEIIERDGKMIAGEFGGISAVKEIVNAKKQLPELLEAKDIKAPYKLMLVKIPALSAMFLYVENNEKEFLVPSMIQPERCNLKNGKLYAADMVLSQLKDLAKEIDGKLLK